ncbi:MAG: PAS domain-containing sensor histidine kinase [Burkholderiaceae bacterium]
MSQPSDPLQIQPAPVAPLGSQRSSLAVEPGPVSYWKALTWFGISRVAISLLLLLASHAKNNREFIEVLNEPMFQRVALFYVLASIILLALIRPLRPHLQLQLFLHVGVDLLLITVLVYYSGGLKGGLGALMIASVAAGSVLATRRLAAFFAAAATLLLLSQAGLGFAGEGQLDVTQIGQAGVLGAACFLTALSVNWLAMRLQTQEELAYRRGEDVRNQLAVTQRVIAESQQGVLVVSAQGGVRTMNRAARTMLGVDESRVIGQDDQLHLRNLLGREWPALVERFQQWQVAARERPEEIELTASVARASPENASRVRVRLIAALDQPGADAVILVENLHELEQRAQQLKLASMGRLSASIAHEIRNPLGAIRHANSLLGEQLESVPLARLSRIVEDNTVRINRVIEDVLSISRGGPAMDEQIDMARFLDEFLPEFVNQAGHERHRIGVSLDTNDPMRFDSNQLRQVLVNLIGNALRYASDNPGAVMIGWRKLGSGRLELSIADDGPGLGPDAVAYAFEPFFTTESRGTGLGLYLARELSALNGASIRYQKMRVQDRYSGAFLIEPRQPAAVSKQ